MLLSIVLPTRINNTSKSRKSIYTNTKQFVLYSSHMPSYGVSTNLLKDLEKSIVDENIFILNRIKAYDSFVTELIELENLTPDEKQSLLVDHKQTVEASHGIVSSIREGISFDALIEGYGTEFSNKTHVLLSICLISYHTVDSLKMYASNQDIITNNSIEDLHYYLNTLFS